MTSGSQRQEMLKLVEEGMQAGARKDEVCALMGVSAKTIVRWQKSPEDRRKNAIRPTPKNKLSPKEEQIILDTMNQLEYRDLPPSQAIPKLADKGIYLASESTFYRVLKKNNQLKHRGNTKEPTKRPITTHRATNSNQVWTWDITYLKTSILGRFFKLYLIMDIFDRSIVGFEVWEDETSAHASQLIEKTVFSHKIGNKPLVLHSDNGSPMKGATFQATLERLGITKSYSRPRVSNDNPYSESLFKTLKYCPKYPKNGFETLEDARNWTLKFVRWYNHQHHHSGINFVTPAEKRAGRDEIILANRKALYEAAKSRNPERWSRETRRWDPVQTVFLNPEKEPSVSTKTVINPTRFYTAKVSCRREAAC